MDLSNRQLQLLDYVKEAHKGQVRSISNLPYHTHLEAVAEIVSQYHDSFQYGCPIEIALCHDLYEDTDVTKIKLTEKLIELGYEKYLALYISLRVHELTKGDTVQKTLIRLENARAATQSVKYADIIHNAQTIDQFEDKAKVERWLDNKYIQLKMMRNGNFELYSEALYAVVSKRKVFKDGK